jgi:phospholipid transport system substrate-binding protein
MRMKFLALFALLLAAPAAAATPEAAPVAALDNALMASMKAGSAGQGFAARAAALDPVLKQSFNLPVVEQNSVGFLWPTIPAAQQQLLASLFEQFTVDSYVSEFAAYSGQQFQLLPAEKTLGAKKIVETQLVPPDGSSPTELDYVVADGADGWQITDVLLNGTISQVAIHSSDFSSLVTSGDASQLIAALKSKIAALSSGSGQ